MAAGLMSRSRCLRSGTPRGEVVGAANIARDITERKQAEEALQESEARLKGIFDSVQTGIMIIDPETHRIVDANPVALKLIGAPREEVVGAMCHKFVCPAEEGRCPVLDLGQTVNNSERILLTAQGERRKIIKTVVSVVISGRKHLLESFIDITERKHAEEALQKSEERFRLLFERNMAGLYRVTLDGQLLDCNDACARIFGYASASAMLDRTGFRFLS